MSRQDKIEHGGIAVAMAGVALMVVSGQSVWLLVGIVLAIAGLAIRFLPFFRRTG